MIILPKRLTSKIRYWRTGRGYGVHSPFAYHFITRVLRERLPYYDFDRLPRTDAPIIDRHIRLLYRLSDFFRPETVWLGGDYAALAGEIVAMADSSVRFVDSPAEADMAVVTPSADCKPEVARKVTVVIGSSARDWAEFTAGLPSGMTFANGRIGVAVWRQGLPRQDFRLRF